MKRPLTLLLAGALLFAAAACEPQPPGRYRDLVFATATKTTATYGTGPDLVSGASTNLVTDVYQPDGDTQGVRPAIVWIHGGGFRGGNRTALSAVASDYARRGYVTMSIEYRLDPGNRCQDIQDGKITDPTQLATELARCKRAIEAAQTDAQQSIRWLRTQATTYRVDPTRIAVGGSSAGAVTAVHVAERSNPGGGAVPTDISVGAALAMSGCNYEMSTVDSADAPISLLHAGGDGAVPYGCAVATANAAEGVGTPVQRLFYPDESGHALGLYRTHQAVVDAAWTDFLITHLRLPRPA